MVIGSQLRIIRKVPPKDVSRSRFSFSLKQAIVLFRFEFRRTTAVELFQSGAILAVLAYTCVRVPDARLQIVFVPGFTFSAASAVVGLLAFDAAGLLFRFRLFDHAAHLGGTLFGM